MDKKIEAMALDKRMYYAQAETMEQGKPLVDILLNFQEVVNVIAERYAVNAEYLRSFPWKRQKALRSKKMEKISKVRC